MLFFLVHKRIMGIFFRWEEHLFSHFTENFEELPSKNYILSICCV